eukprot:305099-Rhodomonas_salina.4
MLSQGDCTLSQGEGALSHASRAAHRSALAVSDMAWAVATRGVHSHTRERKQNNTAQHSRKKTKQHCTTLEKEIKTTPHNTRERKQNNTAQHSRKKTKQHRTMTLQSVAKHAVANVRQGGRRVPRRLVGRRKRTRFLVAAYALSVLDLGKGDTDNTGNSIGAAYAAYLELACAHKPLQPLQYLAPSTTVAFSTAQHVAVLDTAEQHREGQYLTWHVIGQYWTWHGNTGHGIAGGVEGYRGERRYELRGVLDDRRHLVAP